MKRNYKEIQNKKYRKLLKINELIKYEKLYRKNSFMIYWDVSTKYKNHYLYKSLKNILPFISSIIYSDEITEPTLKGLCSCAYIKLNPYEKMCFIKEKEYIHDIFYTQNAYIEKYFLREELKKLLYLKVEPYWTRCYYHLDYSENVKIENYIINHNLRAKANKILGHTYKRPWNSKLDKNIKINNDLNKQTKIDIEETW